MDVKISVKNLLIVGALAVVFILLIKFLVTKLPVPTGIKSTVAAV